MKIFYLLFFISISLLNAQVGINTETPNATLDIEGAPTEVTSMDGLIAPRITGDQLQNKTYTSEQTGAIVYVTQAVTNHMSDKPQTFSVTNDGYYYFDGTKWIGMQKVLKLTKEQANELDYSTISMGDLVFISQIEPEPANPVPQVASINSVGYYYYDNDQWNNQSIDMTLGESVYSVSAESGFTLISLGGLNQFAPIDLSDLSPTIGGNNIDSTGYYVAPSSGYYHVTYEIQTEAGIDLSLLGDKRIWLVKNIGAAEQSTVERKLFDAVRVSLGPISVVTVPVTSTTLTTIVQMDKGETLGFALDKTLLQVGLLTDLKLKINVHKIAN